MPFWSNPHDSSSRDPKRKFRFQVSFDAITDPNGNGSVMWYAKTVNKPSFQIATTEHKYLNHTFYYPGTVTWQDVSVTLVDPIEPDMSITLARILEKSGYILPGNATDQSSLATMSKGPTRRSSDLDILELTLTLKYDWARIETSVGKSALKDDTNSQSAFNLASG